ncbi:hypothetical protein, partial [Clostridium botulinum]|uniref:hypothetical protein n=1 Tax=Clostridium botulinum TaxID=1491 RepID=UPI0004D0361A
AEYMNRPLYEIIATLLHEMVHLYNLVNKIQDVSRNGTYHNKKFKEASEKFGLIVKHDKMIGWSITTLQEKTRQLIDSFNINEAAFDIFRIDIFSIDEEDPEGNKNGKRKSSSRKYVCNNCGAIVRATKELSIICGKCKQEFQLEE